MPKKSRRQRRQLAANAAQPYRGNQTLRNTRGNFLLGYNPQADRKRRIEDEFGYPERVDFGMAWGAFRRSQIARAIVTRIVDLTWSEEPTVWVGEPRSDDDKSERSEWERQFDKLAKKTKLWPRLRALDIRQRVGRYGGLIFITKDNGKPEDPLSLTSSRSIEWVHKFQPVFESQLEVQSSVEDFSSPDYGDPAMYQYRANVPGSRNVDNDRDFALHPSRVFVFAEGADDGSIYGVPALEAPFNALMNWIKISGGAAEGYFKNSAQKFVINYRPEDFSGLTDEARDTINEEIDNFNASHNKSLQLAGADLHMMQAVMADPSPAAKLAIYEFSMAAGLPIEELFGQLVSSMGDGGDKVKEQKAQAVMQRRNGLASEMIEGFIDHVVKVGILPPPPDDVQIEWPDALEPSFGEKLENGKIMMETAEIARRAGMDSPYSTEYIQRYTGVPIEEVESDPMEGEGLGELPQADEGM